MSQSPGLLLTILAFVLAIGPLIFLHELGHYLAGRWFGVKAEEFAVGFGQELAGFTDKRGTRWKLCAVPIGGYVRFAGDMDAASRTDPNWLSLPPEERSLTFPAKALWQRAIIVAAGPMANFLIAIMILAGFAMAVGRADIPPVVGAVEQGSPAASAGLAAGDRITSFDGRPVANFESMIQFVQLRPGARIRINYVRAGIAYGTQMTIATRVQTDRFGNVTKIGRLGIAADRTAIRYVPVAPWEAPGVAVAKIGDILTMMRDVIGQIILGERSMKELGGPLQIAKVSGEQFTLGLPHFIFFIALVSINLGVINLLPVPVLDGGHLLFYAIEAVQRRPVSPQVMEWAFRGGLAAVLALMVMVTVNDLGAFGLWSRLAGLIG